MWRFSLFLHSFSLQCALVRTNSNTFNQVTWQKVSQSSLLPNRLLRFSRGWEAKGNARRTSLPRTTNWKSQKGRQIRWFWLVRNAVPRYFALIKQFWYQERYPILFVLNQTMHFTAFLQLTGIPTQYHSEEFHWEWARWWSGGRALAGERNDDIWKCWLL